MTGHYPATHQRAGTGKNGPVITSTCSCGWKHPAVSHEHSCKLFEAHHVDKTGKAPPLPPIVPRRTR